MDAGGILLAARNSFIYKIFAYSDLFFTGHVDRYIIPFLYLITHLFSGYVCGYLLIFLRINSLHSGNHMIVQWYMKES